MVRRYVEGKQTMRQISCELGCSYTTVNVVLTLANVQKRSPGGPSRRPAGNTSPGWAVAATTEHQPPTTGALLEPADTGGSFAAAERVFNPSELVVLKGLADGLSIAQIAHQLDTTAAAVWAITTRMRHKLGARTRPHAVALVFEHFPELLDRREGTDVPVPVLGGREFALLCRLATGTRSDRLPAAFNLRPNIIVRLTERLYDALGARSDTHAVAIAYRCGLLPAQQPGAARDQRPGPHTSSARPVGRKCSGCRPSNPVRPPSRRVN